MESESKLVNVTRQKDSLTYNNAVTNSTSLDNVVDLFFIAGASRTMKTDDIVSMLEKSWVENKLLTMRLIFWAGDIRGGAGERRFFRIALEWLDKHHSKEFINVTKFVPHFNRWDSLFEHDLPYVYELVSEALCNGDGLCAKWMPRKKQYNNFASRFRKYFSMSQKSYRKFIVGLSKTVEQKMCAKKFKEIDYEHVPSVAMNKYRTAFYRNDESRFTEYIDAVTSGEKKINASAIYPYDIYNAVKRGNNRDAVNAQWNALPNYMENSCDKILPVCDVSGSMTGMPMAMSVSLGLYISERNEGIFKNAFVTFSGKPTMEYLSGSLTSRIRQLERAHWEMNTNLNAVFNLLLERAVDEGLHEKEMPTVILIISDMEFDRCGRLTNYEQIAENYNSAGYNIPKIVFWNVNGRRGNVPVNSRQSNVAMVSGASPSIMKSILEGKDFTPKGIMLETLNNSMYDIIKM